MPGKFLALCVQKLKALALALFCLNLLVPAVLAAPVNSSSLAATNPPSLTAQAAIAIDADTGRILFTKNPDLPMPMASTTKIMTALTLLSIPGVNLDDYTVVLDGDLVGEASMGLSAGQRLKVIDLLYGALMDSANDAAMALARYGGSKLGGLYGPVDNFVIEMNREAARLGLKNSRFQNPHGLDTYLHYSSARDLAIMGWYALQNPTIASIVKLSTANLDGFQFYNISNFIRRYPGATGIKPGETDAAGLCLVASANHSGHNAIVVLLNSPGLRTESDQLMDYAFSQILAPAAALESASSNPANSYLSLPYRFGTGQFRDTWNRTDLPIAQGKTARSWYWGPDPMTYLYEAYAESPGKQRLVQYFDKARMEINDPAKGTVTNGLLVVEMINGLRQEGDNTFVKVDPATVPVAGDADNKWPSYASLGKLYLASRNLAVGQPVTASWTISGAGDEQKYRTDSATKIAAKQNNLGIPGAFWEFLNREGLVLENGKFSKALISNWLFSTGYPVTEAYWLKVKVGGVEKDVLFQAFERRTLTYTPSNQPEFQVEMGNVGLHYIAWRYPQGLPHPIRPAIKD